MAFGVIAGGRIGYMLFYNLDGLLANPLSLFAIWQGGMSFHGGLIGVIVAMWLFARKVHRPFFAVADFAAPWIAPGLGFGRIGNFINGELWGVETSPDAPWAVIVNGVARHPSLLYEAFLEGLVLFVVLFLYARRPRPLMAVSGLFLLLYGVFRFAVEFVRLPDDGVYIAFGWLTLAPSNPTNHCPATIPDVAMPQKACNTAPTDQTPIAHKKPFFVPILSTNLPANSIPTA